MGALRIFQVQAGGEKSRFGDPCKRRSETVVLYVNRKQKSESLMVWNREDEKAFLLGFNGLQPKTQKDKNFRS